MIEWCSEVGVRSVSCLLFCPVKKKSEKTLWTKKTTAGNRSKLVSRFANGVFNGNLRFEYRLHFLKITDILAYIARLRGCPNRHQVVVNGTEGKENV